MLKDNVT